MRIAVLLLLAFLAVPALGQPPVIDSMLIDESKGVLSVYGSFGTVQGKVWCDSIELPVLSWNASLVTATIPDTGKGSAGGVVVASSGENSKERLISQWKGKAYTYRQELHSTVDIQGHTLLFNIRLDLAKLLQAESSEGRFSLTNGSEYNNYYSGGTHYSPQYGYDVVFSLNDTVPIQNDSINYSRGFSGYNRLYLNGHSFSFNLLDIKGLIGTRTGEYRPGGPYTVKYVVNLQELDFYVRLDSEYKLVNFIKYGGDTVFHAYSTIEEVSGEQSFLPFKMISLKFTPSIIAPNNNRTGLGTYDILLQWNTLKYMDAYHVQLSKDSIINGQKSGQEQQSVTYIVDTIVASLDFQLPPLEKNTKYYWRVCGVNTEGESRWSEVWSFTTGTSADVKQEVHAKSLQVYPNPATSEVTIITAEPTRLLLYDMTGKMLRSAESSGEVTWNISTLPTGSYVLGSSRGEMRVVQVVK